MFHSFHSVVQRLLRNVSKSVLFGFANIKLLFFLAVLIAPSSLLKLPIVVIQKFCYHIPLRNVTLLGVFSIKSVSQAIESLESLVPVGDVWLHYHFD